jgi:hypothetical protein
MSNPLGLALNILLSVKQKKDTRKGKETAVNNMHHLLCLYNTSSV